MSSDKNHSEQFERYLKGQMSPKEAHAFEREVLNDPFAQEALEGLEGHDPNVTITDIRNLRKNISKKKNNGPIWLRVAAMIAMLIVGTIAVFYLFTDVEQSQLASEEDAILPLSADSMEVIDIKEETIAEVTDEIKTDFDTDGLNVKGKDEEVVENYLAEKEFNANLEDNKPKLLELSDDFEGTDQLEGKGESISLAEVDDLDEMVVEPAANEMIAMEEVNIPAQAFAAKKKEAINNKASGKSAAARSTINDTSVSINKIDQQLVENTPPKPSIGDSLYRRYLEEELIYPVAAQENNIEGEVILRLTIDASGEIIDIKIMKSVGYGCDEEAKRLISDGSKWNPATRNGNNIDDIVLVTVVFNLD